mgnify:FL=1
MMLVHKVLDETVTVQLLTEEVSSGNSRLLNEVIVVLVVVVTTETSGHLFVALLQVNVDTCVCNKQ